MRGKWKIGGRVFRYEDDSTGPPYKSDVVRGTDAPNRLLPPRDRRRSVGYFIGLQDTLATFGSQCCEPNFSIGGHMGAPVEMLNLQLSQAFLPPQASVVIF
jgi:hypothetical protein